jgi:hypothetical protein
MSLGLPTVYTHQLLAEFMRDSVLKDVAVDLDLTVIDLEVIEPDQPNPYLDAVRETLNGYGVADIALAVDTHLLRLYARREAWRMAMSYSASLYDVSGVERVLKRSQIHTQARAMFFQADAEIKAYLAELNKQGGASGATMSGSVKVKAVW